MMKKERVNLTNIIAYLQGNIRYYLYYSRFKFMIRKHIQEQIDFRIKFMDKECYENGQCKLCGCATTALQMANKQCDKPCYPQMMDKDEWRMFFKYAGTVHDKHRSGWWRYYPRNAGNTGLREYIYYHEDHGMEMETRPQND